MPFNHQLRILPEITLGHTGGPGATLWEILPSGTTRTQYVHTQNLVLGEVDKIHHFTS